jgi:hypothetical protein
MLNGIIKLNMALQAPTSFAEQAAFYLANRSLFKGTSLDQKLAGELAAAQELEQELANDPFSENQDTLSVRQASFSRIFDKRISSLNETIKETTDKVQQEMANIANKMDFSSLSAEEIAAEMANLQGSDFTDRLESLNNKIAELEGFGEDVTSFKTSVDSINSALSLSPTELVGSQITPEGTVRTANGFITGAESADAQQRAAAKEARQMTGAIDPETGLPDNIDYSAFSDEQISYLQKVATTAGDDDDLLNKALNNFEITEEDLSGFLEKASAEVAPYYKQLFDRGTEDFNNALAVRTEARARELRQEEIDRAARLKSAKAGLEAAGLTFSGDAVGELGAESAFTSDTLGEELPFGTLPEQEGLLASSSLASFEESIRSDTRSAESLFGSAALENAAIPNLSGAAVTSITPGVRGTLEADQATNIQTRADELQAQESIRRAATLDETGDATADLANLL